jgi:hypothetical protein
MISVFRASDKATGKLAPLVIIAITANQGDTNTPTQAVALDLTHAREVAAQIITLANEIEDDSRWDLPASTSGTKPERFRRKSHKRIPKLGKTVLSEVTP